MTRVFTLNQGVCPLPPGKRLKTPGTDGMNGKDRHSFMGRCRRRGRGVDVSGSLGHIGDMRSQAATTDFLYYFKHGNRAYIFSCLSVEIRNPGTCYFL